MNGTLTKDPRTGVVPINKETSMLRKLKQCGDFKHEKTQLMYILDLLGIILILTPKCYPEIYWRSVEYYLGYSKLRFLRHNNDSVAKNLMVNIFKSLDREVRTINRARKCARKARV